MNRVDVYFQALTSTGSPASLNGCIEITSPPGFLFIKAQGAAITPEDILPADPSNRNTMLPPIASVIVPTSSAQAR